MAGESKAGYQSTVPTGNMQRSRQTIMAGVGRGRGRGRGLLCRPKSEPLPPGMPSAGGDAAVNKLDTILSIDVVISS